MERASKLVVVGWACAALAVETVMVGRAWGALPELALGAFIAAAVLTAFDRRAIGIVLALAYVFPALIYLAFGVRHIQFGSLWMAALLGAILPVSLQTTWQIPKPWRGPLVCWALVIVVGSWIVFAREFDFTTAVLNVRRIANSPVGGSPSNIGSWVLYVSLVLVLGILWFDWLFAAGAPRFRSAVVVPLAVSFLMVVAASAYQLFVDFSFLNLTLFGALGRAGGTLFDANIAGTIGALWSGGAILLSRGAPRWRSYIVASGVPLAWLVVWASGSRTAFSAAALITVFGVVGALRAIQEPRRLVTPLRSLLAAVIVVGLVAIVANTNPQAVGPVRRLWDTLPALSADSLSNFVAEMWNRNGYGAAATAMIAKFPLFGVGVGSFQTLLPAFAGPRQADNAQNWYRHQFAEVGLIGSLPWIAWVIAFGWFVFRRRPSESDVFSVWTARGIVLSFALISLVGMPAQDVIVAITFWTMAFWHVSLVGVPASKTSLNSRAWAIIAVVVVIYAVGTASLAATSLRVPVRAQTAEWPYWPYSYGFYNPEFDGSGQQFRWTGRRAVTVLEAPTEWLRLTVSVNHRDLDTKPVDVKVWRDRELVLRSRLSTTTPVTQQVRLSGAEKRVLIETWASRVARPSDFGAEDTRELGVMVTWEFVDAPPPDAPEAHGGTTR